MFRQWAGTGPVVVLDWCHALRALALRWTVGAPSGARTYSDPERSNFGSRPMASKSTGMKYVNPMHPARAASQRWHELGVRDT